MKLLLVLIAACLPASLHAALKWERTSQRVAWKPGQAETTVEFHYKNASKAPQKITQLKGACVCCTSARATKKDLAPGESGIVRMRVDFRGKTLPMAKAVTVTTDDGQTIALVLEVTTPEGKPVVIPRLNIRR
jgi:hypothetical protein